YCTIALFLRALALRRLRKAGLALSINRMLAELDAIREVVTVYPRKGRQKKEGKHTVLTKTSELQERLISILGLKKEDNAILG
ncbi:MAG: transposase, partial [Syntrophobacteraceae bacterium]